MALPFTPTLFPVMLLPKNLLLLTFFLTGISGLTRAPAEILARFDLGDTTLTEVQAGFTVIGAAGNTPAAYAGPQTANSSPISLRLTGGTALDGAIAKDGAGNFNSTGSLVVRDRAVPAADTGTFTYSDIYRDFITANVLGIQLSGLTPASPFAVTFYAYDNSGNRTQTFTDITPGSTGLSGSITYSAAFPFTSTTANDVFATTVNALSDANGRLYFSVTGTGTGGSTNVSLVNGIVVDGPATPPSSAGFHYRFDGNFNDSSANGNNGIASGAAALTTDPAAIATGSGALSLDGSASSYVNPSSPASYTANSPWTATWWARRGETSGNKGMIMGTAANTNDFIWLNDTFTGLRFRSSTGNTLDFTAPKDQLLRHYALVADGGGSLTLYLDGQFSATLTGNTAFAVDTIGNAYPTASGFNFLGNLDEVRLTSSAFSASQITAVYDAEKPLPPPTPVTRLRIVLVAGQSNADGRAVLSELPAALQSPQNDVSLFYKTEGGTPTLTTLRPGVSETAQTGPDVFIGRRLADLYQTETGTRVAIIRYANGGTNLSSQWKAGGTATTTGDGPEYLTFQQTVTQGLAALAAAFPQASQDLQSLVWMQGESDAVAGSSTLYQANLTTFIADIRATYGASLPFVIARLSSLQTALAATYLNDVRSAQDNVAAADPRTAIFSTDTFGMKTDNLHFNGSGQQAMGNAFAFETAYYRWMLDTFPAADINNGLAEPGADHDRDGQSNLTEFLAATDPRSGTSLFNAILTLTSSTTAEIAWPSTPSRRYTLQQYRQPNGPWDTLQSALSAPGSILTRPISLTTPRAFYRVFPELP